MTLVFDLLFITGVPRGCFYPSGRLARALVALILFMIARLGRPFLGRDSAAACGPKDPAVASRRPSSGGGAVRQKRSGGGQVADGLPPAAWVGGCPAPRKSEKIRWWPSSRWPSSGGVGGRLPSARIRKGGPTIYTHVRAKSVRTDDTLITGIIMGTIYTSGFPDGARAAWAPGSA